MARLTSLIVRIGESYVMINCMVTLVFGACLMCTPACEKGMEKEGLVWDLRPGPTLAAVKWPEHKSAEEDEVIVHQGRQTITIKLPSGARFSGIAQRVYLGRRDDKLQFIKVHGVNMSLDGAANEAKQVATNLGIPPRDIADWYLRAKSNEGGATAFLKHYDVQAANVSIKVLRTFNDQRPWFVAIEFHFPVPRD